MIDNPISVNQLIFEFMKMVMQFLIFATIMVGGFYFLFIKVWLPSVLPASLWQKVFLCFLLGILIRISWGDGYYVHGAIPEVNGGFHIYEKKDGMDIGRWHWQTPEDNKWFWDTYNQVAKEQARFWPMEEDRRNASILFPLTLFIFMDGIDSLLAFLSRWRRMVKISRCVGI